jgi:hypothetical protein
MQTTTTTRRVVRTATKKTRTLTSLLKDFDKHISVINTSKIATFKIINEIDQKKLFTKRGNFTTKQILTLSKSGVTKFKDVETRVVLSVLYPNFSWKEYVRFSKVTSTLTVSASKRLTNDAAVELFRNQDHLDEIRDDINKMRGAITEDRIRALADKKIRPVKVASLLKARKEAKKNQKKKVVKIDEEREVTQGLLKKKNNEIDRLKKLLDKTLNLAELQKKEIVALRKQVRKLGDKPISSDQI